MGRFRPAAAFRRGEWLPVLGLLAVMLFVLGMPVHLVTVSGFGRLERTQAGKEAEELRVAARTGDFR